MNILAAEIPAYFSWLLPAVLVGILMQFFWSSIVSVVIWRMSKTDRNVESLKKDLHEVTVKLVDERFRAMSHEVNGHVQALVSTVDDFRERFKLGDEEMKQLMTGDHQIEIKFLQQITQVKEQMQHQMATQTDLRAHQENVSQRFDNLSTQIVELGKTVAVLADRAADAVRAVNAATRSRGGH